MIEPRKRNGMGRGVAIDSRDHEDVFDTFSGNDEMAMIMILHFSDYHSISFHYPSTTSLSTPIR